MFNMYKVSEVLVQRSMEMVLSKRDDFVVDALFYFEPMQIIAGRVKTFQKNRSQPD